MNRKTKIDLKKLVFLLPAVFTAAVVFGMLPRTEATLKEVPERIQITKEAADVMSSQAKASRTQENADQSSESISAGTGTGESVSVDPASLESASADTDSSGSAESSDDTDVIYPDGVYNGQGEVYDEEDDEFYYVLDVTITVEDGKIASLDILKTEDYSDDPDRNEKYINIALNGTRSGTKGILEQITLLQKSDELDAVSGATYTSEAIIEMIEEILPEGEYAED